MTRILSPHTFLAILLILGCLLIYSFPNVLSSDQGVITYTLSKKDIPHFSDGIISMLLIGTYNLIVHPSEDQVNTQMRILMMLIYVLASYQLAVNVLKEPKSIFLFLIFLFSSRFPFLWLSRELIYGVFLCLAITAVIKKWPVVVTSILIVFMGHTKPELMIVSLAFMIVFLIEHKKNLKNCGWILGIFILFNALFLIREVLEGKVNELTARSLVSFGQHYADLVYPHQVTSLGDPFLNSDAYLNAIFPNIQSMKDVIFHYPQKYYDFLFLSLGHGVKRMAVLCHFLLFVIFVIFMDVIKGRYKLDLFSRLFLLSLLGCLPIIMYTYPHIRYIARYYPILIIFILSFMENCRIEGRRKKLASGILYSALTVNIFIFLYTLPQLRSGTYWFPD